MSTPVPPADIESLWEYGDPSLSEQRFRQALVRADGDQQLELLTQIARTYSLRGRLDEAHSQLDQVESQLGQAGPRSRVRYLLERGRTLNSGGDKDSAQRFFDEAWMQAQSAGLEGLAVDAAHMMAIVSSGTPDAVAWNERGLEIARQSTDPKARALVPAILNNSAWDLHQSGRFQEALELFDEARVEWEQRGKQKQILIARWSVARCLRSLGRCEEALVIQRGLEAEHKQAGTVDGYVLEEIAENLTALGQAEAARPYLLRAYDELSRDAWFVENEPTRLVALRKRAEPR
jgi:tetratricopeptide (TPR) repeat protein